MAAANDTFTPNLRLRKIAADRKVWTDRMNDNMTVIDAVISSFFSTANMQGVWENSHDYTIGQSVVDGTTAVVYICAVDHTSAAIPTTFAEARAANPTYWTVYSTAATNKGAWSGPGTAYSRNDFVLADGTQYAFCLASHTSGATFAGDLALGYWSVLVDLSALGSLVLPTLSGSGDANKFVTANAAGDAYVVSDAEASRDKLGITSVGDALVTAASESDARTVLGLGTAAEADVGTAAGDVVQLITGNKLPAVDGSNLLAMGRRVIQTIESITGSVLTGTGTVPYDDSIPSNTEGNEYMNYTFTPEKVGSLVELECLFHVSNNQNSQVMCIGLFKNGEANATTISWEPMNVQNQVMPLYLYYQFTTTSLTPITFRIRIGANNAGTTTMNGSGGFRLGGGVLASGFWIKEYAPET